MFYSQGPDGVRGPDGVKGPDGVQINPPPRRQLKLYYDDMWGDSAERAAEESRFYTVLRYYVYAGWGVLALLVLIVILAVMGWM